MDRESFKKSIVDDLLSYKDYWAEYSDTVDPLRVINWISSENEDGYYEYFLCVIDQVAARKGREIEKVLTHAGAESLYPLAKIKVNSASQKMEVKGI
ncbi:hypothetical protein O5O45_07000 [Hahella aquimaris]|uniref:hypothetical protein n=1 Tax=Hahella sp. HNIBRBA332 TaxID=3015983 RepID=UPI00273AFD4B|nr:hypothetical protein [Hahella sp. HNIBRBA332]WLQ15661.1 hypothetical protein O5O45_07000 [Hahella sp. HNIBRBA332]